MLTYESWQAMMQKIGASLPQFAGGGLTFIGFWLAAVILRSVIQRVGASRRIDVDLTAFLARSAYLGLIAFGAVTALGTFGVNVTALVAGLGLTGFALGFALKDIISNLVAGVLILIYKPFQRNDHIRVKGFEGIVQAIDLRYTVLAAKQDLIFLPNAILFTDAITVSERGSESEAETTML